MLALLVGCRDEFAPPSDDAAFNAPPLAQAGTGSTYRVLEPVTLDGSRSFDPDGRIAGFQWTLRSIPPLSSPRISGEDASIASLVADVPGDYVIRLRVLDEQGVADYSDVTITIVAPALTVNAGVDRTVPWLSRVQLAGTFEVEAPFSASYRWRIVARPTDSSAALENSGSLTPSLFLDVPGPYTIALEGTSAYGSLTDEVTVVADLAPRPLGEPQDIAYSRTLDRLVTVSSTSRLEIVDPSAPAAGSVDFPGSSADSLSISPSGEAVAVSLSGSPPATAIVDLRTGTVSQRFDTPAESNVLFGAGNRVFTTASSGDLVVHDLSSGSRAVITNGLAGQPYFVMAPDGSVVYAVPTVGSHAYRFDAAAAVPTLVHEVDVAPSVSLSLPWGAFTFGGSSLVMEDGSVLRTSATTALDLTVQSQLPLRPTALAHSVARHELAVLQTERDPSGIVTGGRLSLIDDTTYASRLTVRLPSLSGVPLVGRWVAYRSDGQTLMIIARTYFTGSNQLIRVPLP